MNKDYLEDRLHVLMETLEHTEKERDAIAKREHHIRRQIDALLWERQQRMRLGKNKQKR